MSGVFIAGAYVSHFVKRTDLSDAELGAAAVREAMNTSGLEPAAVEAGYAGSCYGGMLFGQRVFQSAGISGPPVFTVENACASGASAINLAWTAIRSGMAQVAVVVGSEKLSSFGGGALALTTHDRDLDEGLIMPAAYAMKAQAYMAKYGATESDLADVSVTNRGFGSHNPKAYFTKAITRSDVLGSRPVADPLRLLNCCPNADGAAAVVLVSEDMAKGLDRPVVEIAASVIKSGRFSNGPADITWADITYRASKAAYEFAGIQPDEVDLAEVHDAFSISELIHLEALGISQRGKSFEDLRRGRLSTPGQVVVNPSGGLLSRGHPIGATGVAQVVECYFRLVGITPDQGQTRPRVALAQVTGGGISGVDNGACGVHLLVGAGDE